MSKKSGRQGVETGRTDSLCSLLLAASLVFSLAVFLNGISQRLRTAMELTAMLATLSANEERIFMLSRGKKRSERAWAVRACRLGDEESSKTNLLSQRESRKKE